MKRIVRIMLMLSLTAAPMVAGAQDVDSSTPAPAPRAGGRGRLEGALEARLGEVVKQRLALTDEQYRHVREVNRRYDTERRTLVQQERGARQALRSELEAGDRADQRRVADLIDQMLAVQRQRLDVVAREQHDLSAFLTPVQRAKYAAIQEAVRKRVDQLRRRQAKRTARAGAVEDGLDPLAP